MPVSKHIPAPRTATSTTLTAADVVAALGVTEGRAETLLATAAALVERFAPDAPSAITREAQLRACGWLAQAPSGGQRSEEQGDIRTAYTPAATGALRASGAMALLSPWKNRRAGAIG